MGVLKNRTFEYKCRQNKIKLSETLTISESFCGGDEEIRTVDELLTHTRFPIVRARPTTRHLRIAQENKLFTCQLVYYTTISSACQE